MHTPDFFRSRTDSMIDLRSPLAVLATRIPWARIEAVLTPKFEHEDRAGQVVQGQDLLGATTALVGAGRSNAGRPKTPIRLMASLLYLKHSFNLSDEELCQRWGENVLWQFFSGMAYYEHRPPCDPTQIGRFRRDLGEDGLEQLLKATIDTAVVMAELMMWLERAEHVRTQRRHDKNKLYAMHAPEVECIGKGKARKPYEFGVKNAEVVSRQHGLILGARTFPGNPYDGHILSAVLEQAANLTQDLFITIRQVVVDVGFRGVDADNPGKEIIHRGKFKNLSPQQRGWLRRHQAVEPAIGHLKSDHRLDRCWLQGAIGDALHAISCAAGYNLRWLLRAVTRLVRRAGFFVSAANSAVSSERVAGFARHTGPHSGRCLTWMQGRHPLAPMLLPGPAYAVELPRLKFAGPTNQETAWRDGTTHIVMPPLEFMQRLAALVGPPQPQEASGELDLAATESGCGHGRPARISWARLLKQVLEIDIQPCPNCGGQLKLIAANVESAVIEQRSSRTWDCGPQGRASPRIPAHDRQVAQAA